MMIREVAVTVVAATALAFGLAFGLATAASAEEDEGWSGDIGLSFAQQSGTTNTVSATLDAKTARSWERDEVDARILATLGTSEERGQSSETIQDSQAFFAGWKRTFTERLFLDTRSEISRDGTQDRDLRVAINTGPGVRVWLGEDAAKEHFDVSAGLGYRYEVFDGNANNAAAEKSQDNFVDAVAAFEFKKLLFEERLAFTHTGSARMPINNPNAYILRTEVTVGVPITEAWDVRAGFLAEYIKVTSGNNKELTTRTTIGLGYKF